MIKVINGYNATNALKIALFYADNMFAYVSNVCDCIQVTICDWYLVFSLEMQRVRILTVKIFIYLLYVLGVALI